jgi:hypothetical protein
MTQNDIPMGLVTKAYIPELDIWISGVDTYTIDGMVRVSSEVFDKALERAGFRRKPDMDGFVREMDVVYSVRDGRERIKVVIGTCDYLYIEREDCELITKEDRDENKR